MRVQFGMVITEAHGKTGGQIIQNSYGGYQVRNIVQPVNPQTPKQQYTRVQFREVTGTWRALTDAERLTWITNAPTGVSGFQLFMQTNLPLFWLGFPQIPEWVAPVTPFVNDLELDIIVTNITPDYVDVFADLTSPTITFPVTDWEYNTRWSGWVAPSVALNQPLSLAIPWNAQAYSGPNILSLVWSAPPFPVPPAPAPGWRTRVRPDFINIVTGQINTGPVIEIAATPFP